MVIAICIFLGAFVAFAGYLSHRHLSHEYEETLGDLKRGGKEGDR